MAEKGVRRKNKKKEPQEDKPTDEETAVAKYLRFNLATKSCNFMGNKVEYFTGSKAVDILLDSKWASGAKKTTIIFTHRESVANYLNRLLQKGFYMRALKVAVKKKEKEGKEPEGKKKSKKSEKEKTSEGGEKEKKEDKKEKEQAKSDESSDKKQKGGKRKIKLEGTNEQIFVDGNDAYVWIYDPIKPLHYVYGLGLVIGAIAVCLFPLWPPWMRIGTYYISVGGACLVGSIVVLAIARTIIYGIIWGTTLGKVSWWLFPNLLADVGILESFQPVYSVEYSSHDGKGGGEKDEAKDEADDQDSDENGKENDDLEENVENVGEAEEDFENKKEMSDEDGPSEDAPESIQTESGQEEKEDDGLEEQEDDKSNNEDENISQSSEKSESSSSQGTKDFEMVQKEDIVGAEDIDD